MTYFIFFFIFLPENSKALLQCGLQGGKAKLRSAGRANQGPFQKFVAVCERLGKERRGQPRHFRLHSWKQDDNRRIREGSCALSLKDNACNNFTKKSEPTELRSAGSEARVRNSITGSSSDSGKNWGKAGSGNGVSFLSSPTDTI